ncbi:MAG: serine hydrolase, partial [Candidatus Faecousia sp.]|nr:serine hydrolase [Candidatus Faecousia sp.]
MKKPYFCAVAVLLSFLCGCGFGQFRAGDSSSGASTAVPVQLEPSAETAQTQTSATADNSVPDGLEALQEALQAQLSGFTGQWSVYVKRLDTGQSLCLSDSPMVAASLIKLFVAGAAFQAIADGTLPAGVYDAPIRAMISASDNASCNALIDALGGGDAAAGMEAVNGFAEELGC